MVDATGGSRPGEVGRGDQRAIGALPHHLAATALATVSNAVFITEPDGRIIWVNDAFTHMSGYSYAEAVGSTPRLLRSGVQDDAHYAQLWATILAGRPWRGEVVDRHRDGHLYTVWQTITPLVDDAGEVTHFVAVHEDVTTLRSDQARLQALFDHSPEAILLLDDDATVVEANPAAVTLTGRTGDALTGASIYELVPAGDQRTVERLIAALLDQGRIEGAGWFARGDGTRCKVEYTAVAAITDGLHLVLARDITERRQLEHDLREQTRLLERRAQEQTAIAEVGRFAVGLDDPEAVADEACQRVGELLGPGIEVEVSWDTTPDVTASSDDPPHVVDIGGSGVLIVDGPSARRLDDGDREFLHAMAHVLDTVVQRDLSNARLEHLADH
ncbi:MAG: PAS domain-containing protein, partial [Nitriliruptoraceae bacterium]